MTGFGEPAPSPEPRPRAEILAARRYIFSFNALAAKKRTTPLRSDANTNVMPRKFSFVRLSKSKWLTEYLALYFLNGFILTPVRSADPNKRAPMGRTLIHGKQHKCSEHSIHKYHAKTTRVLLASASRHSETNAETAATASGLSPPTTSPDASATA